MSGTRAIMRVLMRDLQDTAQRVGSDPNHETTTNAVLLCRSIKLLHWYLLEELSDGYVAEDKTRELLAVIQSLAAIRSYLECLRYRVPSECIDFELLSVSDKAREYIEQDKDRKTDEVELCALSSLFTVLQQVESQLKNYLTDNVR
jgi:hypothetical protein